MFTLGGRRGNGLWRAGVGWTEGSKTGKSKIMLARRSGLMYHSKWSSVDTKTCLLNKSTRRTDFAHLVLQWSAECCMPAVFKNTPNLYKCFRTCTANFFGNILILFVLATTSESSTMVRVFKAKAVYLNKEMRGLWSWFKSAWSVTWVWITESYLVLICRSSGSILETVTDKSLINMRESH